MVKKIIFFCAAFLFLSPFSCCVFADSEVSSDSVSYSQTIDLVSVVPRDVNLSGGYAEDDIVYQSYPHTSYYPRIANVTISGFSSYFPADSSGNRVGVYTVFSDTNSPYTPLYNYMEYTETYDLPQFQFPFIDLYVNMQYVISLSALQIENNSYPSIEPEEIFCTLNFSDGTHIEYAGSKVTTASSAAGRYQACLFSFAPYNRISSTLTSISFTTRFYAYSSGLVASCDNIQIHSNLFPFVVSTEYDKTQQFEAAIYDTILNNITPTLDNIKQTINNGNVIAASAAALQSEIAQRQREMAATQASMARVQESQAAAIASLPAAQASADIAAAESNAAAHVEAETAAEAAARSSVASQIPSYDSTVGYLQDFLDSINSHSRTCSFEFPALVVPGMDGVYSAGTLSSPTIFSFDDLLSGSGAVIPPVILTLVQAICTIGLAVFLIRWVQKFISQILGGSGNEGTV